MRVSRKATTILALIMVFFFIQSHIILALSLGPLNLKSNPGEKFRAEIPIGLEPSENVDALALTLGNQRDYSLIGETMPGDLDKIQVAILREGGIKALLYAEEPLENTNINIVLKALLDGGTMLKNYSVKVSRDISRVVGVTRESPAPLVYGPVRGGENLSLIAARLGYSGAVANKAIVAIWLKNKTKFVASNLHGLKRGALLKVANVNQDIIGISSREAGYVISTQWGEWKKITQAKAATVRTVKKEVAVKPVPVKIAPTPEPVKVAAMVEKTVPVPLEKAAPSVKAAPVVTKMESPVVAPVVPKVIEVAAAPTPAQQIKPEPVTSITALSLKEDPGAGGAAFAAQIKSLRGEMKSTNQKLRGEILGLQERLREQTSLAMKYQDRLLYLFYAFLGVNIILMVLLLSRRRKVYNRSYSELDNAGVVAGNPLRYQ